jgi:hypothetical protein
VSSRKNTVGRGGLTEKWEMIKKENFKKKGEFIYLQKKHGPGDAGQTVRAPGEYVLLTMRRQDLLEGFLCIIFSEKKCFVCVCV